MPGVNLIQTGHTCCEISICSLSREAKVLIGLAIEYFFSQSFSILPGVGKLELRSCYFQQPSCDLSGFINKQVGV